MSKVALIRRIVADLGAELLLQVITERAEKASVIITTNLPFSEWTKYSPTQESARHYWID